jgi:hypothetical protein
MVDIVVADCPVVTSLPRIAGLLGGLCWVGRAVLDDGNGPASLIDALHYGGLALLVLALLGIGGELVTGLVPLRVLVAVCLVALAWAVLEFLHHEYADRGVDGVLGGLMAVYCLVGLLLRRRDEEHPAGHHHSRGAHAA